MFDRALIASMRRGAYIVNTARAEIVDRDAIVDALESGQLAGYAGDVWFPQPAPADHPWRRMPHNGMTLTCRAPHSRPRHAMPPARGRSSKPGSTSAHLIVEGGRLAGTGAVSYST